MLLPTTTRACQGFGKLGRVNFKTLTWMIRSDKAQVQNHKSLANVYPFSKRAACEFGKACHQGFDATSTSRNPDKEMELKKGDLFAGQRVSSDHCQSSCPGRLCSSQGGTNHSDMFHGGTIFADNATGYIDVRHQVSLGSSKL